MHLLYMAVMVCHKRAIIKVYGVMVGLGLT
jgi:hypothetical protein